MRTDDSTTISLAGMFLPQTLPESVTLKIREYAEYIRISTREQFRVWYIILGTERVVESIFSAYSDDVGILCEKIKNRHGDFFKSSEHAEICYFYNKSPVKQRHLVACLHTDPDNPLIVRKCDRKLRPCLDLDIDYPKLVERCRKELDEILRSTDNICIRINGNWSNFNKSIDDWDVTRHKTNDEFNRKRKRFGTPHFVIDLDRILNKTEYIMIRYMTELVSETRQNITPRPVITFPMLYLLQNVRLRSNNSDPEWDIHRSAAYSDCASSDDPG